MPIHRLAMVALVLLQATAASLFSQTVLHVSPSGSDAGDGSAGKPFATIARAQQAVRQLVGAGLKAPVTVVLAGGRYQLAEPLSFGSDDGGTAEHAVTYQAGEGQKVLVSGGRRITGWQQGEGGLWRASVPEAKDGRWYFRQLWVDSWRAVRARTPNLEVGEGPAGPKTPLRWPRTKAPFQQLVATALASDLSSHTYTFPPGLLKEWKNLTDVEVVALGDWETTRKRIEKADPAANVAHMAGPHARPHDAIAARAGRWFYLENAGEFLDADGEWYLDRAAGVVSFRPLAGQDPGKAEIVAPLLTHLLLVAGTNEKPVRNLHFRGIQFSHTDWTPPPGGYLGIQANHFAAKTGWNKSPWARVPCALRFDHAESCSVRDCLLTHLGGGGVEMITRCVRCGIEGCTVEDVSGNGIMLGGPRVEEDVPKACRIVANRVRDCGIDYQGCIGIWAGFAQRTLIARNHVSLLPYGGISVGWQWNPAPTPARENVIENNDIHDVLLLLADSGGIYTLGFQPDSIIRGNYIHGVRRSPVSQGAPNNGMFLDEGTTGFTIEGNVLVDNVQAPLRFHKATLNHVRKNWIALPKGKPFIEFNATDPKHIIQQENVLLEKADELPPAARDVIQTAGPGPVTRSP